MHQQWQWQQRLPTSTGASRCRDFIKQFTHMMSHLQGSLGHSIPVLLCPNVTAPMKPSPKTLTKPMLGTQYISGEWMNGWTDGKCPSKPSLWTPYDVWVPCDAHEKTQLVPPPDSWEVTPTPDSQEIGSTITEPRATHPVPQSWARARIRTKNKWPPAL